jgi:hypothetical protein
MSQTYKYTIVGDTQPAVKGNEQLNTSIKQVDASTKQLDTSLQKTSIESQKAFGQELETKIKATDAQIKRISGTVGLFTGTLSTAVGALGLLGIEDEQLEGFQKATLSVLALGSGVAQAITGFKDLTESRKLVNEVTLASTAAENANTAALTAQAAAAGGVTVALGNAATSIGTETVATEANTLAKAANIATDEALFAERVRLSAQGIIRTEAEIAQTFATEANTVATTGLTVATGQLTIAQRALNIVAKANPYIALASIIFAVGTAIFALTSGTKTNTDAEKANAEAREKNEAAMRKEEDASLRLAKARGASSVALAEETVKLAQNRKERAEEEFAAAQIENKFSERTQAAREAVKEATLDLEVAEAELEQTRKEARKNASKDAQDELNRLKANNKSIEGLQSYNLQLQSFIDKQKERNKLIAEEVKLSLDVAGSIEESSEGFIKRASTIPSIVQTTAETTKKTYATQALEFQAFVENLQNNLTEFLASGAGQAIQQGLSTLSGLLNEYGDLQQEAINIELDRIERRYQREIELAGENAQLKEQITKDFEARELEITRNSLEQQKNLRRAQVIVTTAQSVIDAYSSTANLPPPFGLIAGSLLAAAYIGLGSKAIANINATSLGSSDVPGGFNNIPSGGGAFSLGGAPANLPTTGVLPGLGGGRIVGAPTVGTIGQEPLRAYVLAGDVTNGVQANIALNNRRRLAG